MAALNFPLSRKPFSGGEKIEYTKNAAHTTKIKFAEEIGCRQRLRNRFTFPRTHRPFVCVIFSWRKSLSSLPTTKSFTNLNGHAYRARGVFGRMQLGFSVTV